MVNPILPKISIITATFNSEVHLKEALQSVIIQTYPDIEHIIIDGGSTDNTLQIVNNYRHKIATVISEPDNGTYDAFNKGIKTATGDVIYFLNSDDYLHDEHVIETVAQIFKRNDNLAAIYGNVLFRDDKTSYEYIAGKPLTIESFKRGEMCPHPGFFCKKSLFQKYGFFDLNYHIASDFDFVVKCFQNESQNIYYLDKIIAVFRLGGLSSDPRKTYLMQTEKQQIIQKYFGISTIGQESISDVNGMYRIWLETLLLRKKGISHVLHSYNIQKVAIFGTMKTGLYLFEDLQRERFQIVCFLDNNANMQNRNIKGILVHSPLWLVEHPGEVDTVLLSIESSRDIEVRQQIESLIKGTDVSIYSWKDLVQLNQES